MSEDNFHNETQTTETVPSQVPSFQLPNVAPAVQVISGKDSIVEVFAAYPAQKPYLRGRLNGVQTVAQREEFLSEFSSTTEKRAQLEKALDSLGIGKGGE